MASNLLHILEALQLKAGLSGILFKFPEALNYLTPTWLTQTWETDPNPWKDLDQTPTINRVQPFLTSLGIRHPLLVQHHLLPCQIWPPPTHPQSYVLPLSTSSTSDANPMLLDNLHQTSSDLPKMISGHPNTLKATKPATHQCTHTINPSLITLLIPIPIHVSMCASVSLHASCHAAMWVR